ncbi:MAG: TonB-dependent siderophore receptor [Nitrococcus sp.]|nr:TonB-dependent siderophore receptor [Nitrococcus sp.]
MQLRGLVTAVGLVGVALTANMAQAEELEPNIERQAPEQRRRAANTPDQNGNAVKLPALTVTATEPTGYNVPDASTATKTDTPIMKTPVSVQVVPQQVLEDQQVIRLQDALRNVSGVIKNGDFNYAAFRIRGFKTRGMLYRNGLRLDRAVIEPASLQRIEVVKGPASVLYGRIEPGGLINLVTKKPLAEPRYSLQQQFGSYIYRTVLSATGPLNTEGSLLYRAVLSHMSNDTFIDFVEKDRGFAYAALTWRPSKRTEINVNFEYQHDRFRYYAGIPVVGDRPAPIPISRYLGWGAPEDQEHQTLERILAGFEWSHAFNNDWKLTHRFHYYTLDYYFGYTWFGMGVADDGRTFTRGLFHFPKDITHNYTTDIQLTGKFDTLGVKHHVLFGFDYWHSEADRAGYCCEAPPAFNPTIDIFNPVYGSIPRLTREDLNRFATSAQQWYGVYLQDQITLWDDRLHIIAGGRYNWVSSSRGFVSSTAGPVEPSKEIENKAFSPRVGLLYQPWSWLSLYGSYAEALAAANFGRSASGQPFEPQTAQQYEVGFKVQSLDRRLRATVAFYHLTKQNILTRDPNNPAFSIPVGEVRSRGIELDVSGQITNSLSLIATYALTDTEITKDSRGNEGNRFYGVPLHAGRIFAKYSFHEDPLNGLSLGAGVFLVGDRACSNANTCELPGYVSVGAMAAYKWTLGPTRLTAQLNVNNVLDKRYFASAGYGGGMVIPGAPRSFLGLLRVEF